jgi:mono/diheme cytochrome c family protein
MAQWRGWWLAMLAGWSLLCLVNCSDSGLDDNVPAVQTVTEPTITELGLRLAPKGFNVAGLSSAEMNQVAHGSYLVNGVADCATCHTTPAGYLAGGFEFPLPFPDVQGFTSVVSRNLTPDPETSLPLTEDEFIESMRTGKDFYDSTTTDPQRLIVMPWHIYRFMSRDDLKAIYAFLRHIPPVRNAIRATFKPPFPFPPVPFPPLGDSDPMNDPTNAQRGLLIPQFFSSGPAAKTFVSQFNTTVARLTPDEQTQVGRGSYLVNAIAACNDCHTAPPGGLIPMTVEVNTAAYLAGGGRYRLLCWRRSSLFPQSDAGSRHRPVPNRGTIYSGDTFRCRFP